MKNKPIEESGKFSAEALRKFAEVRKIANEAVRKAVEENRKLGLVDGVTDKK